MTRIPSVLAALAACGLASAACSPVEGTEAHPARPVRALTVAAAPAPAGVRYSASIEPAQEVPLAFKASGYVTSLAMRRGADGPSRPAQAGDLVARGTVLARVNDADYRERVNQGRARLAEGEASLRKARLDLQRADALFAADSLIKPELDAARAAFESADARVAGIRADIELALSALADTALVAPASGVLLERRIEVGSLVAAGTVGYVLGDVSSVKARFGIPDAMIDAVQPGAPLELAIDAVSGPIAGRVTALAPVADAQSRVFDVEVTIPNRDGRLRPGMIGTVTLHQPAGGDAAAPAPVTVPLTAIVRSADGADRYAVLVIETQGDAHIARARLVTLGDVAGNGVIVSHGLTAGERIVTTGATLIRDGDPIRVIP
jgi:multidrug efflux system membrane fusion protein